ncbi:hypothetical protein PoB_005926700 [Plakobranchus ocellatus]|uniref:Uncharacterized protein n=1 Tax=Plakobranchus ocellatus TaxID=259542 RepID=A0AAV4CMC3_9GAST|nr:hypothetical protein PoB_005926700 [Plakobranchus ocellatus]
MQRSFTHIHHNNPPSNKSILEWYNDFIERGCICGQGGGHSGRPTVSEEVVERVRDNYLRSHKSTCRYSQEFNFHNAQCARSYANAWGLHLIGCNWSKSYIRETKKRALNFTTLSRIRWKMILICFQR